MTAAIPLAHDADLIVDLPVFLGPVLALVAWLLWARLRGR